MKYQLKSKQNWKITQSISRESINQKFHHIQSID